MGRKREDARKRRKIKLSPTTGKFSGLFQIAPKMILEQFKENCSRPFAKVEHQQAGGLPAL
jgi:hypothetical protein